MSDLIPADQLRIHALSKTPSMDKLEQATKGGQHFGMSSVIALEHEPTGTIIIVGCGRSQHRNRDLAVAAMEFLLTHPERPA